MKQIQDTIRWQQEVEDNEDTRNKKIDLKKSSSMVIYYMAQGHLAKKNLLIKFFKVDS